MQTRGFVTIITASEISGALFGPGWDTIQLPPKRPK